jgi:hypothetical protein
MENITLTRDELNRLLKSFAVVFIGFEFIFFFILWHFFKSEPSSAILRSLSPSLLCASGLFYIFFHWGWRVGKLAKWMGRPVVCGVWLGFLTSDYKKTASDSGVTLPIVFIIRQTYLTLSIQSFTERQIGESRLEALIRNTRTEATRLAYVFELKTTYPGQGIVTSGAGELQLLSNDTLLRGTYWTSSPTHGSLSLRLQSRNCDGIESFEDAKRRWPIGPLWRN